MTAQTAIATMTTQRGQRFAQFSSCSRPMTQSYSDQGGGGRQSPMPRPRGVSENRRAATPEGAAARLEASGQCPGRPVDYRLRSARNVDGRADVVERAVGVAAERRDRGDAHHDDE